jgi:hypothetical protein
MKTKPAIFTIGLIAIVLAGALRPAAGRNIVGYGNVALTNGYNFVTDHFYVEPNNSITNVIYTNAPDGTRVYLWDATNQIFLPPSTYHTNNGWDRDYDLSPGKGFVIYAPVGWTNVFVGSLITGTLTNFIAGSNKFSLLGCKLPFAGQLSPDLNLPGTDGDSVYLFRGTNQSFTDAFKYFSGFGWFDPNGVAGTGGPYVNVFESFFIRNPGPGTNWVIVLNLFSTPSQKSLAAASGATAPAISRISLRGGSVTLQIANPTSGLYDVQFSGDGLSWSTIATKQTGVSWSGPSRGGALGYYRLTNP